MNEEIKAISQALIDAIAAHIPSAYDGQQALNTLIRKIEKQKDNELVKPEDC